MKRFMKSAGALLMALALVLTSGIFVSAAPAAELSLSVDREADNTVTLTWNTVDGAAGYNVYDTPYGSGGGQTQLNAELLTDTTFVADNLSTGTNGLVHTLEVEAVDAEGQELTSDTRNVGITVKKDISGGLDSLNAKKNQLKLPVSDLATSMDYIGPTIQDDQYHYWCYSSVTDDYGNIHLFMSRVPKDVTFIPGWKTTSEIVHFVGDSWEGPFTEVGVPFAPGALPDGQMSAHNPRIKKIDGKYVLLYIVRYDYKGNGNEGYQVTCMATIDELPTDPGTDTIDKWDLVNENGVIMQYGVKAVNPDLMKAQNESGEDEYILYFKGNVNPNVEAAPYFLYYATSSSLEGPYEFQGKVTDATTTIEDPSIFEWKGKYFMLTYDLGSGISGAGSVGMLIPSRTPYFFSFEDAWITAGFLDDYVNMPAGSTHAYSGQTRMERPYIVFNNDEPAYFVGTNSEDVNGNKVTQSYTFRFDELPKHTVSADASMTGGTIEIENQVTEAEIFDDIIFTVTPDSGYELVKDSLVVKSLDAMGRECTTEVEDLGDGRYRFMMPSGDATICAEFKTPGVIESVEITPESAIVVQGGSQQFTASVTGSGDYLQTVDWSVEGGDAGTSISADGLLTVSETESHETLTVKAVSREDSEWIDTATVYVEEQPENLALGLDESSYTASTYHKNAPGTVICYPKNAFDGNSSYTNVTYLWTPAQGDTDPWIQVNFGEPTEFNTVKLYDYGQANGGQFASVTIQVSDDGQQWKDVQTYTFEGTETVKECVLPETVCSQYLRIGKQVTTDSSKFVHLLEVEVYNVVSETEKQDSVLEITSDLNKTYDGQACAVPEVSVTGSSGDVEFFWYQWNGTDWTEMNETPVEAGTYKVVAKLEEDVKYNGAEVDQEFVIGQAANSWTVPLAIESWTYGDAPKQPSAQAQYGSVTYLYSGQADGTYTAEVPTEAGTWYVKAVVAAEGNYGGLESEAVGFEIAPKDGSVLTISDIQSEEDIEKLVITDGDYVLEKGVDYLVTSEKTGNQVNITITFQGNYTGTVTKSFQAEDKNPGQEPGDGQDKPDQKPGDGQDKPDQKPGDGQENSGQKPGGDQGNQNTGGNYSTGSADTGDSATPILWTVMILLAGGAIAMIFYKKSKI